MTPKSKVTVSKAAVDPPALTKIHKLAKKTVRKVTSHRHWAHARDAVMTLGVSAIYIGSKYGQPWNKEDVAALLGIIGGMYTLAYSTPASALKNQTAAQAAQSKDSTS